MHEEEKKILAEAARIFGMRMLLWYHEQHRNSNSISGLDGEREVTAQDVLAWRGNAKQARKSAV